MSQKSQKTQIQNNQNTASTAQQISFPEVCVVEASAGSGKTYALASRYLKLLLNPTLKTEEIPLKNILAVTFTNKAAFEMKARILHYLKKLALDIFKSQPDKENLLNNINVPQDFAQKKAFLVMDYIINNYNYFQVQTIDSFINAILSGCAFKLDLSADFRIKHDHREQLVYSFDNLIDEANHKPELMSQFINFLENYLYLENKKSWLPKKNILEIMEILLESRNTYGRDFVKSGRDINLIKEKKEYIRGLMLKLKSILPDGANLKTWGKFAADFNDSTPVANIEDFFGPFTREDFSMRKGSEPTDKALALWKQIKENIRELFEWQSDSMFNCYIDIFEGVLGNFNSLSRFEDIIFLEELNSQARKLFDEEEITVPELYYRLATQFRHFLIDEFQDTSLLQWNNLSLMIEDALSRGGSLFYVGDKKQAIYRFRGGDVRLFDNLKEALKPFNVKERIIAQNYRSQKEVVEFNNAIFSHENIERFNQFRQESSKASLKLEGQDVSEISSIFSTSCQQYKEGNDLGYVKAEFVDLESQEQARGFIKERVINSIRELKERFNYRDIAILCRANNEVEEVTSWLLDNKIPVESEKTLNIRENSLIKELVCLLKFLNSPIDDLAFANFILGDIFVKISGIDRQQIREFLFSANKESLKVKNKPYLYRVFRSKYPLAWENYFEGFYKTIGFIPLYEFIITILDKFRVMDNFPSYQGFVMKFLEIIKEQEDESQGVAYFLDFFENELPENLYVRVLETESVKVITIHKAKGLEFPVVIIPFFEINIRIGAGAKKSGSFILNNQQEDLRLNYLKKELYLDFSPKLANMYREEFKNSLIDELNSLYVACTRPKCELYIYIPKKSSNSINIARFFINNDNLEKGSKAAYHLDKDKKGELIKKLKVSEYRNWITFLKEEFAQPNQVKERSVILKGQILHYLLSFIGNLSEEDLEASLSLAIKNAALKFNSFCEWGQIKDKLNKLLTREPLKKFFYLEEGRLFQEKEIVDKSGNTRRVDRLVITKKEILIVDYKSSKAKDESYHLQLKDYALIMKDIYADRPVKCFLIYLDDLSLEEVKWQEL